MLTFAEELVLLLHDEAGAPRPIRQDAIDCALAGAALMELAFAGRIDTDLRTLTVTDASATGHPALDRVLAKLAARAPAADTRTWIGELCMDEAGAIHEAVLSSLVARERLARRAKGPWGLGGLRYPKMDDQAVRGINSRIRQTLAADDIPEPRDVALISLLDACDLLGHIIPSREIDQRRARIEQLHRMDLIGREVANAIATAERSTLLAIRARSARVRRLMLQLSALGALGVAATLLAPRVAVPDQLAPSLLKLLWFDGLWQQWSGYLLLGVSGAGILAALLVKARPVARRGGLHWWRLGHVGFGLCCVLLLFAHTGFRLGANLNAALMLVFSAALLLGALAGVSTYAAAQLRRLGINPRVPKALARLHRIMLYPLPALLVIHILVVYLY